MKVMKYKKLFNLVSILIAIFYTSIVVHADAGPKQTLTIYVINSPSDEYYLDLLVDKHSTIYFANFSDEELKWKDLMLSKYDVDGYRAVSVRCGDSLIGKKHFLNSYKHFFSYRVPVPKEFKIIYEDKEGNISVSNKITTNKFFAAAVYDFEKNQLQEMNASFIYLHNLTVTFGFVFKLLLTIVIELLIFSWFKSIRRKKPIVITNILTQIYLNVVFVASYYTFLREYPLAIFLYLEVSIIYIEYKIYKKYCEYQDKRKLLTYSILANLITMLLGMWISF